jgi:hypothetical protein
MLIAISPSGSALLETVSLTGESSAKKVLHYKRNILSKETRRGNLDKGDAKDAPGGANPLGL